MRKLKMGTTISIRKEVCESLLKYGADMFSKLRAVLSYNSSIFRKRIGLQGVWNSEVSFRYDGEEFKVFFSEVYEYIAFLEVFGKKQYYLKEIKKPNIIVDLGGNVGMAALFFHCVYPEAEIYTIEADPETFARLDKNTKNIKKIHCYNYAIAASSGTRTFHRYIDNKLGSSLVERVGEKEILDVQAITLSKFMEKIGLKNIDLLKFDIEGAEYEVFSNVDCLKNITNLIGEVHLDIVPTTIDQFLSIFKGYSISIRESGNSRSLVEITRN